MRSRKNIVRLLALGMILAVPLTGCGDGTGSENEDGSGISEISVEKSEIELKSTVDESSKETESEVSGTGESAVPESSAEKSQEESKQISDKTSNAASSQESEKSSTEVVSQAAENSQIVSQYITIVEQPSVQNGNPEEVSSSVEVSSAPAAPENNTLSLYKKQLNSLRADPSKYMDSHFGKIDGCEFAIADVTDDGIDDLLVNFKVNSMAGMTMQIWSVSGGELVHLGSQGSFSEFYRNGYVKSNAYHNQGPSLSVWPFSVVKYDPTNDSNFGSSVFYGYSVDKKAGILAESTYDESLDKDGDGVIYYIDDNPMTKDEFDAYVSQYIPEENKIELNWQKLTAANVSALS